MSNRGESKPVRPTYKELYAINAAKAAAKTEAKRAQRVGADPVMPSKPMPTIPQVEAPTQQASTGRTSAPLAGFLQPKPRRVGRAYLWFFLLGIVGMHKIYTLNPTAALIYRYTLGMLGIGLLWDLFTLPAQIRAANAMLESGAWVTDGAGY